jgi:hypothetical protein
MLKKLHITLVLSLLVSASLYAEWVTVDKNKTAQTPPSVILISDDAGSTVFKVDIAGFEMKDLIVEGKVYQSIDLLNDIFSREQGYPQLPHIAEILAIPDQSGISVEIIETGNVITYQNIYLPPVRASWYEGHPETAYLEDSKAYSSSVNYPSAAANFEAPVVFRDFRMSRISVYPIRYEAAARELKVASSLTVRVSYGSGVVVNPKKSNKRAIAPSFGEIYRGMILNYEQVLQRNFYGVEEGREMMLCIMPDEFEASFQVYADWKRQSGTDIHISTFTDIGANASNPEIIKTHITDAYFNWDYPPTYVLIVGDNGVFPLKTITYPDYSFAYEDFFVEIDGNDFFPDVMIGRFTNQGDYRMRVMINKFQLYEQNPYIADTSWFKHGVCCSNNAYESQVETKRFAAQMMREEGHFHTVDTMMSDGNSWGSGCTYTINDVLNTINGGISYLNYRGEGWSNGWNSNCSAVHTGDLSGLAVTQMFPFVTNIGCGVAMFNTGGGNCFGEEWVQKGTISEPKGAVAFVGPTSNTHTTYNNKIDKGIYQGMFKEGLRTPGQALNRGRLYLYAVYGTDPWVEYHYRVYCILGDPSIKIWKEVPKAVNVTHPTALSIGYNQAEVTVTYASGGLPAVNADVCITGPDVFKTGKTDAQGKIFMGVVPQTQDTLTVTVTGEEVVPYQGIMTVAQSNVHVGPSNNPTVEDISGNTDGLINPNENTEITFTLKNWGLQTADNVEATLTTNDTNVVIVTSGAITFGNISSGNATVGSPFQIYVKPNCPLDYHLSVLLNVSSGASSWTYQYQHLVLGPRLNFNEYVVLDNLASTPNNRLDPGETATLLVSLKNDGFDKATDVSGILRSLDPFITITDSTGLFYSIYPGSISPNTGDYFEVSVDPLCPVGHLPEFTLELNSSAGSYPYNTTIDFIVPIALPTTADCTGPDGYGYYAYSSEDTLYQQAPVFDWYEINSIGTEFVAATSEVTTTVSLPFTFKYYGVDYTDVRISTDGWIAFGNGTQTTYDNQPLPYNDVVAGMVAAFWDDLHNAANENGKIYYYSDLANNRFIIEWDGIGHWNDGSTPKPEVFQVILLDPSVYLTPTGDGEILIIYNSLTSYASNTVGIENHTQDDGLQYVFNNAYDLTASALKDEFALKFTTHLPTIYLTDENLTQNNDHGYQLSQNQPNPFRNETWIEYTVPQRSTVGLSIYNIKGQLVRILQNKEVAAGKYAVKWDGLNANGNKVSSGIYFYKITSDEFTDTKKLFKLK